MTLRGFVVAGVIAASSLLSAQQQAAPPSLGDVARQAEAAKATAKKAKKSYTNADLAPDPKGGATTAAASAPASPPAGVISATTGKPVTSEELIARSEEKVEREAIAQQSEADWRARAESIRVQITRLQDQMAAMTQPNAARDANPAARARFDADVARVRTGLDGLQKQWAKLEDAARYAKVKTEWLDPRPKF